MESPPPLPAESAALDAPARPTATCPMQHRPSSILPGTLLLPHRPRYCHRHHAVVMCPRSPARPPIPVPHKRPALVQQPQTPERPRRRHQRLLQVSNHHRPAMCRSQPPLLPILHIHIRIPPSSQMRQHRQSVIVSLHRQHRRVIFLPQLHYHSRKLSRRIMPVQLRALHPRLAIDHLPARAPPRHSSARRIDSNHILPPRLRRQPDRQAPILPRPHRIARRLQRPLHRIQLEHTCSRCPETRHRIFGKFLHRQPPQRSPLLPPPRNLLVRQPVRLRQFLFFHRLLKRGTGLALITLLKPPREKVLRVSRLLRPLPLLVKLYPRPIRRRFQHNLSARHQRCPQRSQCLLPLPPPSRDLRAVQILDRPPTARVLIRGRD